MSCSNVLHSQSGGGIKKSNGHKDSCECPICVNIKHAKGGAGYDIEDEAKPVSQSSGAKKSNGHKAKCGCPICKNMKKHSAKNVTMKSKGGKKKGNGHKATCGCPICKNIK